MMPIARKHRILVVDDEPDIHAVTKLSLKSLARAYGDVEFVSALDGAQAKVALRQYPDIAVALLDVVMETDDSGLLLCRAIREEFRNPLVRILLRTGQPGVAPEQQTIDTYDIDGYLAKTETSARRLYTAVRCALKSYDELVALERHRSLLAAAHDCAISLTAELPIEQILRRILETALSLCPAPLAALHLETFEHTLGPRHLFLYLGSGDDPRIQQASAEALRVRVQQATRGSPRGSTAVLERAFVVPLLLHHELGHGWIALDEVEPDDVTRKAIAILAAHAQNAIYASIALAASRERKDRVFDEATI